MLPYQVAQLNFCQLLWKYQKPINCESALNRKPREKGSGRDSGIFLCIFLCPQCLEIQEQSKQRSARLTRQSSLSLSGSPADSTHREVTWTLCKPCLSLKWSWPKSFEKCHICKTVKVEKDDFCAQSRPPSCPPVGNSIFCPPSGQLHLNSPKSTVWLIGTISQIGHNGQLNIHVNWPKIFKGKNFSF